MLLITLHIDERFDMNIVQIELIEFVFEAVI